MSKSALRLMRAGLVPADRIDLLTIGRAPLDLEAAQGLEGLQSGSATEPSFVNGEWGTGKTHSLAYLRFVAGMAGSVTASIVLDARGSAPTHPQRLHPLLAREMQYGGQTGLRSFLPPLLKDRDRVGRAITLTAEGSPADVSAAIAMVRRLVESGETARTATHPAWRVLTGADIAGSDYAYRRGKALERIAWTARFLANLGAGGLVLFLDELETIDQLWNSRSRAVAYDTFGQLTTMPYVWCVFGVTDRFLRVVYDDARSGIYLGGKPAAEAFLRRWRHAEARLIAPPSIERADARRLAGRVSKLYRETYGTSAIRDEDQLVDAWISGATLNPRRLVRAIVDAHDRARPLRSVDLAPAAAA